MSGGIGGGEGGVDVEMLTTKGDTHGFDTDNARVPIGANNQVLTADSAQALGLKWATPTDVSPPTTTKGDLSGFSTSQSRIPIGSNTQVLMADSTEALGLKWANASSGVWEKLNHFDSTGDYDSGTVSWNISGGNYSQIKIISTAICNGTITTYSLKVNGISTSTYATNGINLNASTLSGYDSGGRADVNLSGTILLDNNKDWNCEILVQQSKSASPRFQCLHKLGSSDAGVFTGSSRNWGTGIDIITQIELVSTGSGSLGAHQVDVYGLVEGVP